MTTYPTVLWLGHKCDNDHTQCALSLWLAITLALQCAMCVCVWRWWLVFLLLAPRTFKKSQQRELLPCCCCCFFSLVCSFPLYLLLFLQLLSHTHTHRQRMCVFGRIKKHALRQINNCKYVCMPIVCVCAWDLYICEKRAASGITRKQCKSRLWNTHYSAFLHFSPHTHTQKTSHVTQFTIYNNFRLTNS